MQARHIPKSYALKLGVILVSGALLSACGGGDDNPAPADQNQNPTPTTPAAGTVSGSVTSGAVSATAGTPQTVTVAFKSSGSSATNLSIDRASLPAEWTVTDPGTCASVSSTGGCNVTLTFTPTASTTSGSLPLKFNYTDSVGAAKTGTVAVPFTVGSSGTPTPTTAKMAYITNVNESNQTLTGSSIVACTLSTDGKTLTACSASDAGLPVGIPTSINFSGANAYVTNFGNTGGAAAPNSVSKCTADATTGALTCTDANAVDGTGTQIQRPYNMAFNTDVNINGGTDAYILSQNSRAYKCTVGADGNLSNCAIEAGSNTFATPTGMAISGTHAYVANFGNSTVSECTIAAPSGGLTCAASAGATGLSGPRDVTVSGSRVYIINQTSGVVTMCSADATTGALSSCMDSGAKADGAGTALVRPNAMRISNNIAYITSRQNGSVTECTVDATTGMLSACASTGVTGTTNALGIALK